jgi:hypothetical protein
MPFQELLNIKYFGRIFCEHLKKPLRAKKVYDSGLPSSGLTTIRLGYNLTALGIMKVIKALLLADTK